MSSLKAILTAGLIAGMNMPLLIPAANAQVAGITVTLGGVSAAAPAKGETQSLNVSQGSRTTLSVGNGVQIGTQAQMSSSIGTISLSRSVLEPTSVTLGSTIGRNDTQTTVINIENITANGSGGNIASEGGSNIEVDEGSRFASGRADIVGMTAYSDIVVDTSPSLVLKNGDETTLIDRGEAAGKATYFAAVNPEVIKDRDPFYRELLVDANDEPILDDDGNLQYTGAILTDKDGDPLEKGRTGYDEDYWETVNACSPSADQSCIYEDADLLKTGNANASSSYQTTTNIDINSNNFTNVFGQAF